MGSVIFLYSTAPNEAVAKAIAGALVERNLAACVNIIPGMISVYRWRGGVEEANERVLIVKTIEERAAAARALIASLHPYETPAIAALAIDHDRSSRAFCDWIRNACIESPPATIS